MTNPIGSTNIALFIGKMWAELIIIIINLYFVTKSNIDVEYIE